MFRGDEWFAWFPVTVSDNGQPRIAWLEWVWRDRTYNEAGAITTTRYYTR